MPDFSDPSFRGEGRDNPKPAQRAKRPTGSLSHLNLAKGTRIRVLKDNNKRGLVGLEGVVIQSFPGAVVVELDNDPMLFFRADMASGFANAKKPPQRYFQVIEVERA